MGFERFVSAARRRPGPGPGLPPVPPNVPTAPRTLKSRNVGDVKLTEGPESRKEERGGQIGKKFGVRKANMRRRERDKVFNHEKLRFYHT